MFVFGIPVVQSLVTDMTWRYDEWMKAGVVILSCLCFFFWGGGGGVALWLDEETEELCHHCGGLKKKSGEKWCKCMSVKPQCCLSQNWVAEVFSGIPVISVQPFNIVKSTKRSQQKNVCCCWLDSACSLVQESRGLEFQGQFTPKPPCFRCRKGSCSRPTA